MFNVIMEMQIKTTYYFIPTRVGGWVGGWVDGWTDGTFKLEKNKITVDKDDEKLEPSYCTLFVTGDVKWSATVEKMFGNS